MWLPRLPAPATTLWLAPLLAAVVVAAGWLAGRWRARGGRVADTRKLFHFVVFATAAILFVAYGTAGANLLGGMTALYIAAVLRLGAGHQLYEALARPGDEPHRSRYIVLPYMATAAGGMLSVSLFGPFAVVGIAVCGLGDAVGEPIGARFGRHTYRVPMVGRVLRARRSLEGSAAVLIGSWLAAVLAIWLADLAPGAAAVRQVVVALIVALVATLTEALAHHGLDNFFLQVLSSGTARLLLRA